MRNLHAREYPVLTCLDASLASQSQKASTLIPEILKRFTATGVLSNVHTPAEALDPTAFPDNFTDGMNSFCERRNGYDDENIAVSDGLKRDFVAASQPAASGIAEAEKGSPAPAEDGEHESGE